MSRYMSLDDASRLLKQTEERIAKILNELERETECNVVKVSYTKTTYEGYSADIVEDGKVSIKLELK